MPLGSAFQPFWRRSSMRRPTSILFLSTLCLSAPGCSSNFVPEPDLKETSTQSEGLGGSGGESREDLSGASSSGSSHDLPSQDSQTSAPSATSSSSRADDTSTSTSSEDLATYPPAPTKLDYSVLIENSGDKPMLDVPVTYGQVFLEGDVPAGSTLQGNIDGVAIALQVDAKATHPDKSLRHAVISTIIPKVEPGQTLRLNTPSYVGKAAIASASLKDLLDLSFDATLELDVQQRLDPTKPQVAGNLKVERYRISARELLTASSPETWLSGKVVTEWMVAGSLKRVDDQESHPHLSARFHIRFYPALSQFRVDVAVENNWAFEEKPQNIYYDLSIKIGDQQRYSLQGLPHFKHSRWRKTFWSGPEPELHLRHQPDVLIDSKAVPHYDRSLINNISPKIVEYQKKNFTDEVKDQCAHYKGGSKACTDPLPAGVWRYRLSRTQPMGKGLVFYTGMASPGDTNMLGPLPTWSAAYVLAQDPFTKKAMLGTGDLGGSWGIHYRDRSTGLPLSLQDHPRATIDERFEKNNELLPRCTATFPENSLECSIAYKPDTAHQPSLAYLPYLVTGDYYYLEELQFWASYNAIANRPEYRAFEKGIFANFEDRGQAWTLRKLARVAAFTPDNHPLKSYFNYMLDANLEHYEATYLKNSPNDYGSLLSRIYPRSSPWMDDFFTWAIQMTANLGFEKAQALAKWKGNFPVMRMGKGSAKDNDYCYLFAAAYHMSIGAGSGLSELETVGMYKTIKEVYEATNGKDIHPSPNTEEIQFDDGGFQCASEAMATHLGKQVGEMAGNTTASAGYLAILQMALASAVDAGTPAALDAWKRYQSMPSHPEAKENPKYTITPRKLGVAGNIAENSQ